MRMPKYRKRPDRDYAFVEHGGKRHPLPGRADSPESLAAYHEFVQQLLSVSPADTKPVVPRRPVAVIDLGLAYLDFAKVYYLRNGRPGTEYVVTKQACKVLHRVHGDTPVGQFGPIQLKEVRQAMIDGSYLRPDDKGTPWTRSVINKQIVRIRRVFKWGVEHEMVPPGVLEKLKAVAPLRKGKTAAKDRPKIKPAPRTAIDAVLAEVTPTVAAMIRLQDVTGMRSQNLCGLRPGDIDRSKKVWIYFPVQHKGDWREADESLAIPLGPKAQAILAPFMDRPADTFCFSPRESEEQRSAARRAARKTKVQPSQAARDAANDRHGFRHLRTSFTTNSYRRSIWFAVKRINAKRRAAAAAADQTPPPDIQPWHPHQLRHEAASRVRKAYGLEGAQVYLGHAHANVTEIYAERDLDLARQIAQEMG